MIDLIIPIKTGSCDLRKILLSVLVQTIHHEIKVILVFSDESLLKKNRSEIHLFSQKLNINSVVCDDDSFSLKQFGFNMSNSSFVMFLNENDFLYDAFSVENAYKKMEDENIDVVCGKEEFPVNGDFLEIDNIYMSSISKMFRRSFLYENGIFFDSDKSNDCYFVGSAILLSTNIAVEDFIVAVYRTGLNETFLSDAEVFVSDTIKIIEKVSSKIDNELMKTFVSDILKNLYNNYSSNLGFVDSLDFFKLVQPLELIYKNYI